jgi:hypothetical protein
MLSDVYCGSPSLESAALFAFFVMLDTAWWALGGVARDPRGWFPGGLETGAFRETRILGEIPENCPAKGAFSARNSRLFCGRFGTLGAHAATRSP